MSRRVLQVEFVNDSCTLIRGPQSRELIMEITRKAPVWAVRDRAWVAQPHTARDVVAVAEMRGYDVVIAPADPGVGRW